MNYIYDILVNFQDRLYDFYEWNVEDEITHIRKIPLFYVPKKVLDDLKFGKIKIEGDFLKQLEQRTEIFTDKNVRGLPYVGLFCDGKEAIVVSFNKKGVSTSKSRLLVEEEEEVLELISTLSISGFDYQVFSREIYDIEKTRSEIEMEKYIKKELKLLEREENFEKLKYLYFECFCEREEEKTVMISRMKKELEQNFNGIYTKMYDFLKLSSMKH